MSAMGKYFNGGSYVGKIERKPFRSTGVITDIDGSVWLPSGSAVPASQSPQLAGNPAYRCVVPSAVSTPLNLNGGSGFKFFAGAAADTGFLFNRASLTYQYTTDGLSWSAGAVAGVGATFTLLGTRVNGTSVELYGHSSSNQRLYRAVITQAAPQTCNFVDTGFIIPDSSYIAGGDFAYDAVNGKYFICYQSTSSPGFLNSISSSDGVSWSSATGVAASGSVASTYTSVRVAAKPAGGFSVVAGGASSSFVVVFSTTLGASYTQVFTSLSVGSVFSAASKLFYFGSKLFFFAGVSSHPLQVSADQGLTFSLVYTAPQRFVYSSIYFAPPTYSGARIAFYSYTGEHAYINFTADGETWASVPYFGGGDSSTNYSYSFFIGNRFFIPPNAGSLSRLFKTENAFTPNASTDYVGIPDIQMESAGNALLSLCNHLRIA